MPWKEIIIATVSAVATIVITKLCQFIYNRIPFVKHKKKKNDIKKNSPKIVYTYTRNHNDIKSINYNSTFFEVVIRISVVGCSKTETKLTFNDINQLNKYNFKDKVLLTIINQSYDTKLLYFVNNNDEKISLDSFKCSLMEANQKITLVFDIKDSPKKILISVNGTPCIYDTSKLLGNNDYIYANVDLRGNF